MIASGHVDSFCRDHLPPVDQRPDFLFGGAAPEYAERLNAAVELLDGNVEAGRGDKVAIYSSRETVTYRQLLDRANQLANYLVDEMGIIPGNRVLLHGFNGIALSVAWYAVLKSGAVAVTTMPMLRSGELAKIVSKADVNFALCDSKLRSIVDEARELTGKLTCVADWSGDGALEAAVARKPASFNNVDTARDDVALLACTSGTTGEPKACAHYHSSVLAMADSFARHCLEPVPDDIYAGTPPLAFTFGLGAFLVFPARAGIAVAFPDRPGFEALCETVERFKVTTTFTAPTGYRAMMGLWDTHDLSSLRKGVSAGEHLPEATSDEFLAQTGIRLIDGIGATEMIHIFISTTAEKVRPGATGRVVPGYEARISGEDGQTLPHGETGRLALKGPTGCLYLDDDRQSQYVKDGWNYTGDLYFQDEDGYFWYVSRADDLIVSSGYNIAGPEVEQALLSHESVSEAAVVGLPDKERGAVVSAFIVLKNGISGDDRLTKQIQDHVKANIAPYKYPRRVEFIDALPKTQTGKIQRFKLRG